MAQKLKFGNGTWATKEGSTLAYNDENENYKPLPFSFTRDSIATRVNKEGLIEVVGKDIPRIDYTDSADGVLLLEPNRTNSILQSNKFDTTWTLSNASVVGNQSGIYNTTDAWKLVGNGSNNDRINSNSLSSGAYTFSIYAKAGNSKFVAIVLGSAVVYYNIEIGSVTSESNVTNSSIESVGNEWYRLTMSVASGSGSVQVYVANADGNVNTSNGDFIYIQHAQAEVGTYATSIIPTSGSTVQRAAETANDSGNSEVFNDSEGVLFADISALADDLSNRGIAISDGSVNNRVTMFYTNVSNAIQVKVVVGGSNSLNSYIAISNISLHNKFALKYKQNDFSLFVNGFELITDTSGNTFSNGTLNDLSFDSGDGAEDFYGKTKEIGYYDTALTDLELETLTSYRSLNELVTELNLNTL